MILNILEQIKPDYMVAALDGKEPTFRVEEFTSYKAQRKPMEDDLKVQIPKVFEVLDSFGIKKIVVEGYEADDIIGTVATRFKDKVDIVIVSNDRDLWQLAGNGNIIMVPGRKGQIEWMGEKEVDAKLGFKADRIADYKGLRGDTSDNIPGVYGIGEVTATKLLQKYDTLEEIYKNIDTVEPESLRKKLVESYEQALMSKKLAQIIIDVPFQLELEECRYREINKIEVKEVLEKYNFKSLIKRMGFEVDGRRGNSNEPEVPDNQLTLL
jgi:DNA polymerase-1